MVKGNMKVQLKNEKGMALTQEHGFTVEEADGKVLAFDLINTEEHGISLLFGNQIFFLKYWDEEDLAKAESVVKRAIHEERLRRRGI